MSDGTQGQLRFLFLDLMQEIEALQEMAAPFIDARSALVLEQLKQDLEGLWSAGEDSERRWTLGDLWTVVSDGEYEPGQRRGERRLVACVSGTWDVRPLGVNAKKPQARQKRLLEFYGIASTRVRFFDASDLSKSIAMWRLELGDAKSPGCYFHVQILGEEEEPPFPKSVSVPRLPSLFVTPMGAIEYVLGEVFQDRWAKVAMENTATVLRWSGMQQRRLLSLLEWQKDKVKKALTSPWMTLKAARPEPALFLKDQR